MPRIEFYTKDPNSTARQVRTAYIPTDSKSTLNKAIENAKKQNQIDIDKWLEKDVSTTIIVDIETPDPGLASTIADDILDEVAED